MLSGEGSAAVPAGLDAPQLHTRVSVGQLRSALLQQTASATQPEKAYAHLHVRGPRQPVYLCGDLESHLYFLPAALMQAEPRPLWIWP